MLTDSQSNTNAREFIPKENGFGSDFPSVFSVSVEIRGIRGEIGMLFG
jgi:hypothetical protein